MVRPLRKDRLIAVSALLFVLLTMIPLYPGMPHPDLPGDPFADPPVRATDAEMGAFFEEWFFIQQLQTFGHALGGAFLLVFAAALASVLREAEGADRRWSSIALAGGIVTVAMIVVSMGIVSSAITLHRGINGEIIGAFYALGWDLHFKMNYVTPVFIGAASLAIRRTRVLPGWLAWSGLVIAALTLLTTFAHTSPTMGFFQFPPFGLLMIWVLATGITAFAKGFSPAAPAGMDASDAAGQ